MAQCHYHPDARGSANCPTCKQHICDKCRMRGTPERCMTCQSNHSKGGADGSRPKREMCANHPDTPSDMKCVRCRKIHCPACLNGANKCFRCALLPAPGERGTGQLKGGGTGSLKGGGTGNLRKPYKQAFYQTHGFKQVAGGGAVLLGCYFALKFAAPMMGLELPSFGGAAAGPAFTGKAKVEIVSPAAGRALTGNQVLKFKVSAGEQIDRIEVTVDGKHWERIKKPPFQSEWQTQIFKNGSHVVMAKAVYKGGKKIATTSRRYKTANR